MSIRNFALIGLSVVSCLSAISPAFAQFKDAQGNIHIQNLTPAQKVAYEAGSGLTKKVTTNFCGLLIIGNPSSTVPMPASIDVDGVATDTTTLPVFSVPSCTNNVLKDPRPANFKDATGRVVLVGKTPGVQSVVSYTGVPLTKSLTANACGYARISSSITNPAPATFTYLGTAYTTATLPVQIPNRCIDGNKFVYTP